MVILLQVSFIILSIVWFHVHQSPLNGIKTHINKTDYIFISNETRNVWLEASYYSVKISKQIATLLRRWWSFAYRPLCKVNQDVVVWTYKRGPAL